MLQSNHSITGTILVADDQVANQELLQELLTAQGFKVITAMDGASALDEMVRTPVDLVILDVMMPHLTGFEVCEKIKNSPDTYLIPVILVTSLSDKQDRLEGIKVGADDFLTRPVDRVELLARVQSLIKLKQRTDELERAESVLFALARSIEGKDPYTGGHCERLAEYYDSWRMAQFGFRSDWRARERDQFTFQGDIYKGGVGQRVGWGSYSPPEQIISDRAVAVSGGNLLARWRHDLRQGSDIQIQAYYDRTYASAPHYEETRNTFDLDFLHHVTFGRRQTLIWGLGARLSPSDFVQTVPMLDFIPHHISNNVYSGFLQEEIALVPNKFSVTIGSKLEHNNYTGFEVQPSVRGLWTISPKQALWAAVTRAVRTPSRIEEDFKLTDFLIPSPLVYLEIDGNKKLSSERLLSYEAGYRTLVTPSLYLDLAVFHNEYDNLVDLGPETITTDSTPAPAHFTIHFPWANGIKGSTNGFEISPDWKPSHWWQAKATYSYLNLSLENMPGNADTSSVSRDEGSSPHNQITIQSRFNLPKGFEFDQTYRYVSALPAQQVKGFSTADLHLTWWATKQLECSIVGENLFQPQHNEFGQDPGPIVGIQRSIYAKITWRRAAN